MAMTPKQLAQYKKTKEDILKLEKQIEQELEKAAQKSGAAYERHKAYLLKKGKELETMKAEAKLRESIKNEAQETLDITDRTKVAGYDIKSNQEELDKLVKSASEAKGKLNKKEKYALGVRINQLKTNIEDASIAQKRVEIEDALLEKMGLSFTTMKAIKEQAILLGRTLMKNPLLFLID